MEPIPPPPVAFELEARDVAEIRKAIDAFANGWQGWIFGINLVVGLANGGLRLWSYGWYDKPAWAFIIAYLAFAVSIVGARFRRFSEITPHNASVVSFDTDGVRLVRRSRFVRRFAYARIARVRVLRSTLVIEPRRLPAIGIPLRALPSDGAQLIEFFEDRLVGKRLLRRQSQSTIVANTATA